MCLLIKSYFVWFLGEFAALTFAIREVCVALIKNRVLLNQLDSGSGDGDCGSTLESGANGQPTLVVVITTTTITIIVMHLLSATNQ